MVASLIEKGYNEVVAQKAALLSGNKTEEDALKWINDHKNDADFNEPVQIGKNSNFYCLLRKKYFIKKDFF